MRSFRGVVRSTAALLTVGFLALLLIVGMTFWLGKRAEIQFDSTIQARDARAAAVELRYALQTAESSQRGYLVTGNQIYLAPYATAKTLINRQLEAVATHIKRLQTGQGAFDRLKEVIADKIDEMDTSIALVRERRNADAQSLFRTNRGKALMDEANVFLSSIIRSADDRLTNSAAEQRGNAAFLLLSTIIAGTLMVLVVGVGIAIIFGSARDLAKARDEVAELNTSLEGRVEERTAELTRARTRAEALVDEVNHRVANSLSIVAAMVTLQARQSDSKVAKDVLEETQARILAVSEVHKRLYSSGDTRVVALDEYLTGLLEHLQASMRDAGHHAMLKQELEPLRLATDRTVNLGVVATEWVTNAFKYAYPDESGEVRVSLRQLVGDGSIELIVEDDGIGRDAAGTPQGTGLGTKLVNAMAGSMGAEVSYQTRRPGTTARLIIPSSAA
jgi:two-component sensor histidine kinase/CHASE3 domain sensor protein